MMNIKRFHEILDFPGALPQLRELAANFARDVHRDWPNIANTYPLAASVWKHAGEAGITGIGLGETFGGQGGSYVDISACAGEISFWSQSPGLGLSFFIHQLVAHFSIGVLGSSVQKEELLPGLAAGTLTAAHAVSEPETGGNPKQMKTKAERDGSNWILSGEKTFVTNGPIAGVFVTLAVTGEKNGRREFSAFLVPADSDGVHVRDLGPLPFLNPAPHGAIRFNEVRLPAGSLLGKEGEALEFLSRVFVRLEDVLMAGSLVGGFAALFMCLCRDILQDDQNTVEKQKLAGRLQARLIALASLAGYGADRTVFPDFPQKSEGLNRAIRDLCLLNLALSRELARNVPLERDTETLFNDLEKSGKIGGQRAIVREEKAGRELLTPSGLG